MGEPFGRHIEHRGEGVRGLRQSARRFLRRRRGRNRWGGRVRGVHEPGIRGLERALARMRHAGGSQQRLRLVPPGNRHRRLRQPIHAVHRYRTAERRDPRRRLARAMRKLVGRRCVHRAGQRNVLRGRHACAAEHDKDHLSGRFRRSWRRMAGRLVRHGCAQLHRIGRLPGIGHRGRREDRRPWRRPRHRQRRVRQLRATDVAWHRERALARYRQRGVRRLRDA